ncbi:DNA-processing protein DprA [Xanthocytophaga flava]|uniref:DNA-processing protein DprA n=1 Tax=Xanthocytophaga flava TaxID=3048013 RepID=UPI0028D68316|nr:DNA-processing protein DprA [Xanthocytophaga flavus]MDJ1469197.1 DNA-processing protein DprA [Xanthocytophaga flavus]
MEEEIIHQIALSLTPGIGIALSRQLVSYCGSAQEVFKASKGKLTRIPGIGDKTAEIIHAREGFSVADFVYEQALKQNVRILFYTNKDYPTRLKQLPDAPMLLYYKGTADLNAKKVVAIVGTRNATTYGKKITEELITSLSVYPDVLVVSGLAYGIDITAHKASVKHSVPTVGVLGSGIDTIYPAAHKNTAQQMFNNGGLLTEYTFGTKPDAPHFPDRNRIVAGMSDVTIVVEAAIKGGALITAQIANDYNRDVMAIPGSLDQPYSAGCNRLIRNHQAHIYTSLSDLEYLIGWAEETGEKNNPSVPIPWMQQEGLSESEKSILTLLTTQPDILIDDLSWKSQIPVNQMASILLTLELQGLIKSLPGKRFSLA